MEGEAALRLIGGALQFFVGFLVIRASGGWRLKLSLATLFLLNGAATLGYHFGGSRPGMLTDASHVFDRLTGAFLIDVGVLLAGARFARYGRLTGGLVLASLVMLPAIYFGLGAREFVVGPLGDLLVTLGFLSVAAGSLAGYVAGDRSRFSLAIVLAFLPRPVYFIYAFGNNLDVFWVDHPVNTVWRGAFVLAMVLLLVWALTRRDRQVVGATLVAATLAGVTAIGLVVEGIGFDLLTLLVSRPGFLILALYHSTPRDLLHVPRPEVASRIGASAAGVIGGYALVAAFSGGGPGAEATGTLVALSGGLIAFAAAGLPFAHADAPPGASPEPPARAVPVAPSPDAARVRDAFARRPPTQGERVLLALRGVAFDSRREAPAAASTGGLSLATGIPGKHLPEVVRRLNERPPARIGSARGVAPPKLVAVDEGPVRGVRRRAVPRYRLTEAGEEEAARVAAGYGVADVAPDALRGELQAFSAAFDGQNDAGERGEPRVE